MPAFVNRINAGFPLPFSLLLISGIFPEAKVNESSQELFCFELLGKSHLLFAATWATAECAASTGLSSLRELSPLLLSLLPLHTQTHPVQIELTVANKFSRQNPYPLARSNIIMLFDTCRPNALITFLAQ